MSLFQGTSTTSSTTLEIRRTYYCKCQKRNAQSNAMDRYEEDKRMCSSDECLKICLYIIVSTVQARDVQWTRKGGVF